MNGFVRRQRGLGMIGLMAWLALGAVVLTLVFKLGPKYMEFLTVKSAMNSLAEDVEMKGKGRAQIMSTLGSRLDVNNVRGLPPQAFSIEQKDSVQKLIANYEQRVHLMFNIDAVVSFNYGVSLPHQ